MVVQPDLVYILTIYSTFMLTQRVCHIILNVECFKHSFMQFTNSANKYVLAEIVKIVSIFFYVYSLKIYT